MKLSDSIVKRYDSNLLRVEQELENRYGDRYTTYRKNYTAACEFQYEPSFPLYIMLEQTYSCNLKCPSCIHGFPEDKKVFNPSVKIMPRELFERVVLEGEENDCPSLAFHVNDEPLIVPDLPDRIAFAKKHKFMDLLVTTNGTLLTPKLAKELIDGGVTRILFSIDAATSETYDVVRPGLKGGFEKVWKNINELIEIKEKYNLVLPAVRASFVESRNNQHEAEMFVEKFSELADYVEIQAFSSYYDRNKDLIPDNARKIDKYLCSSPWRELIVRADGSVLPCCSFYGYEIGVGNVYETSLKEIFQGEFVQKLRQEFKEGEYRLSACQTCADSFYVLS